MEHEQIIKALKKNNLSFSALARARKCSVETIRGVSDRKHKSAAVAKIIATAIGKPVEVVFPDCPEYACESKAQQKALRDRKASEIVASVESAA